MIDRVARAICFVDADANAHESYEKYGRDFWRDRARAAIEAMREVGQEQFLAAEKAGISFATQQRVWPVMIDAALAEQKTPA